MPNITTCPKCATAYEAGSEEQANEADRLCPPCFKKTRFYVEIVKGGNPEEVTLCMGPMSKHRAEKVEDGANVNLNHDAYFTRMVRDDEHQERKGKCPTKIS